MITEEPALEVDLQKQISSAAFAFRGYNVVNVGRTPELLRHRAYGPIVEHFLNEASAICESVIEQNVHLASRVFHKLWPSGSSVFAKRVNLAERMRTGAASTLETYAQDFATIIAVELAQVKLLDEFFGISVKEAQLTFGYSLGEVTALIVGGAYDLEALLTPLLVLADDTAALARHVRLGVLFSRGPALDLAAVKRLCLEITSEGRGMIAVSSFLSPNTVLLIGQERTVDRFKRLMRDALPEPAHLRKNPHRWPPLHTPITWYKNIPNRAGVMLATAPRGFSAPTPPVLSMVTGAKSYTAANSRELMTQWVDHPQRVWDVVGKTLAADVDVVVHSGPGPNILPATFNRLSNNVTVQLSGRTLSSFGRRAMSRIVRRHRPWLANLLTADATLLRAPFVKQIILEDWLLEQDVK